MPDRPNVLFIRRRYLGDIALLGPALGQVRRHWPGARLTLLVEPAYAELPRLHAAIDEVWTLPAGAGEWPRFLARLRRARFTHVLDFDNTDKTALLTRWSGAAVRVTLRLEGVAAHFPACYTAHAAVSSAAYSTQSIQATYGALLRRVGIPAAAGPSGFAARPADRAEVAAQLPAGTPRVLVHPGSRSTFRQWPAENFAAVCDHVQAQGGRVILAGGPADTELLREIRARARTELWSFAPPLPMAKFAALAGECQLLLCHDSGPMHVAAALGVPVVALFGSQNATVWQPVGPDHTVLQAPQPCADCVAPAVCDRVDSYRNYCVRRISPATVIAAVGAQLARRAPARP